MAAGCEDVDELLLFDSELYSACWAYPNSSGVNILHFIPTLVWEPEYGIWDKNSFRGKILTSPPKKGGNITLYVKYRPQQIFDYFVELPLGPRNILEKQNFWGSLE